MISLHLRRRLAAAVPAGFLFAALLFAPAATPCLHAQSTAINDPVEQTTPEAQLPEKAKQEGDETDAFRHSDTVKYLGGKLGMNADQAATVFTLLNFLVLAVLVGWGLLKTLPKTFRKRTTDIQKHLVDARTATEEATARLAGVEARLAKLDDQIAAMRAQADKDSAQDEARMKAAVEDEKLKIVAAAEQEIASATVNAQRRIQQYAAELAIEQATRKLVVTAEMDRLLVQSFAKQLAGDESKGGQN